MGPYVDSVIPDEVMPATTSVVVIGGGIVGTFAALTLAGRGIPVVLCEKGYIACEQSSRNWGWCRQAGPRRTGNAADRAEFTAVARHEPFDRSRHRFSRVRRSVCGRKRTQMRRVLPNGPAWPNPMISVPESCAGRNLLRSCRERAGAFACGLYVPTDGCAEPQRAAPAIARAAQRKGAIVLAHCAVRGIERTRRPSDRRYYGTRSYRLRCRCSRRRRMVEPFLRQYRYSPAAIESTVLRDAHGAGRRWAGRLYVHG